MNYENIRGRAKQFESVTSLKVEEFDKLLCVFSDKWRNYYRIYTVEGKRRKQPYLNAEKDTKSLASVAEKLFFILVYMKNYSLQEMLAASFGFSQSQASKWQKCLMPLLQSSLKSLGMAPARQGENIERVLNKFEETQCLQDVSERKINRPSDNDEQESHYSGKKKAHTIKNNFVTTPGQFIVYVSPTYRGTVHDKKIADHDEICFPSEIHIFQDSGFQGFIPNGGFISQPYKKPKNGELTDLKKWFNSYVSSIRIAVEHAISGIKRCRVIKDKCRHFCRHFRDQTIEICAGLHNFRVCSPFRKFQKCPFKWTL